MPLIRPLSRSQFQLLFERDAYWAMDPQDVSVKVTLGSHAYAKYLLARYLMQDLHREQMVAFRVAQDQYGEGKFTVVEIGVRAGYSGYAVLTAMKEFVGAWDVPVLIEDSLSYMGFDNYAGTHGGVNDSRCMTHARKAMECVTPHAGIRVKDTQKMFVLPPALLYHVDGDHTYDGCMHDLAVCRASNPDAVVMVDDFDFDKEVTRATLDFARDCSLRVDYYPSFRGEAVLRKRRHVTVESDLLPNELSGAEGA